MFLFLSKGMTKGRSAKIGFIALQRRTLMVYRSTYDLHAGQQCQTVSLKSSKARLVRAFFCYEAIRMGSSSWWWKWFRRARSSISDRATADET